MNFIVLVASSKAIEHCGRRCCAMNMSVTRNMGWKLTRLAACRV
jgi:hypothetical protein